MLSAASISALPISGLFASTGMIIWALVGLAGMLTGLITVGSARRRHQPIDDAEQVAAASQESLVSPDALTQAA